MAETPGTEAQAKLRTFIDNREGNQMLNAVRLLMTDARALDIATGFFEIGSFLDLDGHWQNVPHIRLLMGDEVTRKTKVELVEALRARERNGIERVKTVDDWSALRGLLAFNAALVEGRIQAKVYTKAKFHAKALHFKTNGFVNHGLIGSSNFTHPGLTQNLELNLLTHDQSQLEKLQEWYDEIWGEAEDITEDLLCILEPHVRAYSPFEVYLKGLHDYFAGREKSQDAWEAEESVIYAKLSQYQRDGYHRALQIAEESGGALVCDGVGLGKTFIGLMVLERCLRDNKRILLIVPKSAEKSVWLKNINEYLKPKYPRLLRELLDIRRHTDFGREGTINEDDLAYFAEYKDVILIDEAHHFRNPNSNRGKLLKQLAKNKQFYFLTATPINNSLDDLYHLINYFALDRRDHFARIGIQDLRRYFLDAERRIEEELGLAQLGGLFDGNEFDDFLRTDALLKTVLIQRSRKYVKESEALTENAPVFPVRQLPRVVEYSLRSVYESLYTELKDAFDKNNPFLSLAVYNTSAYDRTPEKRQVQQQKQVIGLIRTLLLKRLESSFKAFEASVEDLLVKMVQFVKKWSPERYDAWDSTNRRWWSIVQNHVEERLEKEGIEEDDNLPDDDLSLFDPREHDMDALLRDVEEDMRFLTDFLSKIYRRFYVHGREGVEEDPAKDDKLQQLLKTLKEEPLLKGRKVLIFTEFKDTARYLARQLKDAGLKNVEQIDSGRNVDNREDIIKRFAPHYNCRFDKDNLFDSEFERAKKNPIDILISTDVLSEGLNLQDASLMMNYDLHWNPVRLMQRIGRVDRRLNSDIEKVLQRPADLDGKVYFWNFLPPDELEDLLRLKKRVSGKIVRINKTLGIEGALLSPDDPEMSLKEFNEKYEGQDSIEELMHLEQQRLSQAHPELWEMVQSAPDRLFSGKRAGDGFEPMVDREGVVKENFKSHKVQGLFLAYRMPSVQEGIQGPVKWYFVDAQDGRIHEGDTDSALQYAWAAIRCVSATERFSQAAPDSLTAARKKVESHIKNTYLRAVQAPIGANPILLEWMEVG